METRRSFGLVRVLLLFGITGAIAREGGSHSQTLPPYYIITRIIRGFEVRKKQQQKFSAKTHIPVEIL